MALAKRWVRQDEFDTLLYAAANAHGIPPVFFKALVAAESAFNPQAYREEPPKTSLPPTADYPQGGDASYGLTQVLSRTARGLGYQGPLGGLYDPATNLNLGATYLGQQWSRYSGDPAKAAAAYNAGSARYTATGSFINQAYVDRVMSYAEYFRQWEAGKGAVSGPKNPIVSFPDLDATQHRDSLATRNGSRAASHSAPQMRVPWVWAGVGLMAWIGLIGLAKSCGG